MPGISERDPKDRINMGVLVTGRTGSGKSRMAKRLAEYWNRILAVDPTWSYTSEKDGWEITTSYEATVRALALKFVKEPFKISAVYDTDEEYEKLFDGIAKLLRENKGRAKGFLVVVDEVDKWTSPMDINEHLSQMYRYGRHSCMSWVAACRADTQTNRDIRMNASEIIVFKQGMLSKETKDMIRDTGEIRGKPLPPIAKLTPHGRDEPPEAVEDTHFVCTPDTWAEFETQWSTLAKGANAEVKA
jgi:hypothetical protein